MEKKLKHLEFIQGVISRFSTSSFVVKGWTVTVFGGLIAYSQNVSEGDRLLLFFFVPIVLFWLLDAFLIRQERLFRSLYNKVADLPEEHVDFSMDTSAFKGDKRSYLSVIFSLTLILYYGIILLTVLALFLVN